MMSVRQMPGLALLLTALIATSTTPASAGVIESCQKVICGIKSVCTKAKVLGKEIVETRGGRVLVRKPTPEEVAYPGWTEGYLTPNPDRAQENRFFRIVELAPLKEAMGKYLFGKDGMRFTPFKGLHQMAFVTPVRKFMQQVLRKDLVPTLFASMLMVTVPSAIGLNMYLDFRQEQSLVQLDRLIETDLRFEPLLIARENGTLDTDSARVAAVKLKILWEEYTHQLLSIPITPESIRADVKRAELGEFPFQHLRELFQDGVRQKPGARIQRASQALSTEEKFDLVYLTHYYNLKLITVNEMLQGRSMSDYVDNQPMLLEIIQGLKADAFAQGLLQKIREQKANPLEAYHFLQEDVQNQMDLGIADKLGISFYTSGPEPKKIDIKILRAELLNDHNVSR